MTSQKKFRYPSIDGMRGIFILVMASGHFSAIGPAIEPLSYRWISFADPSQGFVFMSSMVLGLVLTRRLEKKGLDDVKSYAWGRVKFIYKYHITTLIFAMIVASLVLEFPRPNTIGNSLLINFALGATLLHQPHFLDILPLYLVLVAITPTLLNHFSRGNEVIVFALSFCLWVSASIGISQVGYTAINKVASNFELEGRYISYFDVFAWQIIYVFGVFIGYLIAKEKFDFSFFKTKQSQQLAACALLLALLMLAYKNIHLIPSSFFEKVDKSRVINQSKSLLTLFVLCSFASFAYLLTWLHIGSKYSPFLLVRNIGSCVSFLTSREVFIMVGRNSIQAFATHLFWLYGSFAISAYFDFNGWYRLALFILGFFAIYAVVILKDRRQKKIS